MPPPSLPTRCRQPGHRSHACAFRDAGHSKPTWGRGIDSSARPRVFTRKRLLTGRYTFGIRRARLCCKAHGARHRTRHEAQGARRTAQGAEASVSSAWRRFPMPHTARNKKEKNHQKKTKHRAKYRLIITIPRQPVAVYPGQSTAHALSRWTRRKSIPPPHCQCICALVAPYSDLFIGTGGALMQGHCQSRSRFGRGPMRVAPKYAPAIWAIDGAIPRDFT